MLVGRRGNAGDEPFQRFRASSLERFHEPRKEYAVKRYEGLFILDLAGREEGLNDVVEKVKSLLAGSGAKVETVQKMDKKSFARVTDKKVTGGHFVNVVFEATPTVMTALQSKFIHVPEVYRVQFGAASKFIAAPVEA